MCLVKNQLNVDQAVISIARHIWNFGKKSVCFGIKYFNSILDEKPEIEDLGAMSLRNIDEIFLPDRKEK